MYTSLSKNMRLLYIHIQAIDNLIKSIYPSKTNDGILTNTTVILSTYTCILLTLYIIWIVFFNTSSNGIFIVFFKLFLFVYLFPLILILHFKVSLGQVCIYYINIESDNARLSLSLSLCLMI
jgi:hypothetical protein